MVEFQVSSPTFIEETAIANVWKVKRENGQNAALKVYKKQNMGNERTGFAFLKSLDGTASAEVFEYNENTAVIEWLSGQSLGDLARSGHDEQAATELVAVANKIHSISLPFDPKLPKLEDWFKELFQTNVSLECPKSARQNFMRCQDLACELLSQQHDIRPLHGDLHHDNIRLGTRGYCAFDAKGVLGERTYELANAFRNPKGAPSLVRDPARVRYLCIYWSEQFNVDQHRLMQWVAAKCALSIAWRSGGKLSSDAEFDVLEVFLSVLAEC